MDQIVTKMMSAVGSLLRKALWINLYPFVRVKHPCLGITKVVTFVSYIFGVLMYIYLNDLSSDRVAPIVLSSRRLLWGTVDLRQLVTQQMAPPFQKDIALYKKVWDAQDLTLGPDDNSGYIHVATYLSIIRQKQGVCPGDPSFLYCPDESFCTGAYGQLRASQAATLLTGKCVPYDYPAPGINYTCEVEGWCPVSRPDVGAVNVLGRHDWINLFLQYEVLVRFSFPDGTEHKLYNFEQSHAEYPCVYNSSLTREEIRLTCPRFNLSDILHDFVPNKPIAVFYINVDWHCDFSQNDEDCQPTYSLETLDSWDPTKGEQDLIWWMSGGYKKVIQEGDAERVIQVMDGYLFVFNNRGFGRKFNRLKGVLAFGALLGYSALVSLFVYYMFRILVWMTPWVNRRGRGVCCKPLFPLYTEAEVARIMEVCEGDSVHPPEGYTSV